MVLFCGRGCIERSIYNCFAGGGENASPRRDLKYVVELFPVKRENEHHLRRTRSRSLKFIFASRYATRHNKSNSERIRKFIRSTLAVPLLSLNKKRQKSICRVN